MGRTRGMWGIFIGSGSGDGQPEVSSFQMEGVCIWGLSAHHGTGIQEELSIPSLYGTELFDAVFVLLALPSISSLQYLQPYTEDTLSMSVNTFPQGHF